MGYQSSDVLSDKSNYLLNQNRENHELQGSRVAFSETNTSLSWPKAEISPDLAQALKAQISQARQSRRNFNNDYFKTYSAYAGKDLGGYIFKKDKLGFFSTSHVGPQPLDVDNYVLSSISIRAALGRIVRPGLFSGSDEYEKEAEALVIAVAPLTTVNNVINNSKKYYQLSMMIGDAPVFVVTNTTTVFMFHKNQSYIFAK